MTVNNPKRSRVHLAMFAKYWERGKVKTRLAASIGESAARDIHLLFVRFLLQKFVAFGDSRTLVGSPDEKREEFLGVLPEPWQLQLQSGGDLGSRMSHFFQSNATEGQCNVLIGSDTPDIPESHLQNCVELLQKHQLVLGPSRDGGYYLIAMQRHIPEIFENVAWSSTHVFSQTLELAQQNSISCGLLPELNDVDELDDLQQLLANLKTASDDPSAKKLLDALEAMELNVV